MCEVESDIIPLVIKCLVEHWRQRIANFEDYLKVVYGRTFPNVPTWSEVILLEMEDGSIDDGNIGRTSKEEWAFQDGKIRKVDWFTINKKIDKIDDFGTFFTTPSYMFVFDNPRILLSEQYGGFVNHRSVGKIVEGNDSSFLELTTLWHGTGDPS